MNIDGKENVKERIKVSEKDRFITYLYIFENGNSYRETVDKWKPRENDLEKKNSDPESILDHIAYRFWHRR